MSKRTLRTIWKKMFNHPLFPLLFLTEAVKLAALGEPLHVVARLVGLSVGATIIWVLSDAISIEEDSIV